jgi:hypothetical protein
MSFNKAPIAFDDVREVLNQAIDTKNGIKITFETLAEGARFRQRAYYYIRQDRENSKKVYPEDHPMHGVSVYDKLCLYSNTKECALEILPSVLHKLKIQEL